MLGKKKSIKSLEKNLCFKGNAGSMPTCDCCYLNGITMF